MNSLERTDRIRLLRETVEALDHRLHANAVERETLQRMRVDARRELAELQREKVA